MAQTPEVKVKARVRAILDALGIYYFMPPANGYGRQGIPDIICCMAGRFVAIECKAGKGQLTELQKRELDKIMNADGLTYVAREDNLIELKELLNEHRNYQKPPFSRLPLAKFFKLNCLLTWLRVCMGLSTMSMSILLGT